MKTLLMTMAFLLAATQNSMATCTNYLQLTTSSNSETQFTNGIVEKVEMESLDYIFSQYYTGMKVYFSSVTVGAVTQSCVFTQSGYSGVSENQAFQSEQIRFRIAQNALLLGKKVDGKVIQSGWLMTSIAVGL